MSSPGARAVTAIAQEILGLLRQHQETHELFRQWLDNLSDRVKKLEEATYDQSHDTGRVPDSPS